MLSEKQNHLLTEVGPGTRMGAYLRRFWHPIAGRSEFDDCDVKAVRLLGEDLVLYRDLSGEFGLINRRCPHRGADLANGYVEACGLRCNYHGWLFDRDGSCLEQPYEDVAAPRVRFRDKIRTKSYLVQAHAGMLFAYLGPDPAPLLPDWEPFSRENGFIQIVKSLVPCNWFQCQENSIDPVHFEWMHANWSARLKGRDLPYTARHIRLAFDEFEFGLIYRRVTSATDETDPLWTVGRVCLWPNGFVLNNHIEWRVPVDDTQTLSISWIYAPVPEERRPYVQAAIPTWESPVRDPQSGKPITTHVINQDISTWIGQGAIVDRTQEHLGRSDMGIVLLRKRMFEELDAHARGEEPKGLIRDPRRNSRVELPIAGRSTLDAGIIARKFVLHAGQPDHVRASYEDAMGFELETSGLL